MKRIDSIEDRMRGIVTYELGDGRRIALDECAVRNYGAATLIREYVGEDAIPKGRSSVFQRGNLVGTVPATFDPLSMRSRSFMYDVRPGDFVRSERGWEASKMLGPGDLSAVPGFIWADDPGRAERDVEEDRQITLRALASVSIRYLSPGQTRCRPAPAAEETRRIRYRQLFAHGRCQRYEGHYAIRMHWREPPVARADAEREPIVPR